MNLPHALSTAAAIALMDRSTPENVTHIDALLTRAGAALHQSGNRLEELATSMALGHLCDISMAYETIEECVEALSQGGDVEAFEAAVEAGEVPGECLAFQLAHNYGPLSALDGADKAQADLARKVSVSLRSAVHLAAHVEKLRYNNLEMAASLLFSAVQICRALDPEQTASSEADTSESVAA